MEIKGWNEMMTIFCNIDTQYDFMRDDKSHKGALAVPNARKIERNLEAITRSAEAHGYKVINTADWHDEKTPEISANPDYMNTFPPHCMQNTKGAMYVPATNPKSPYVIDWKLETIDEKALESHRNIVLLKNEFDVFAGNPHAPEVIGRLNPEAAVVYGVCTNVCVDYAVVGLRNRGIEVYVPVDAIKELPSLPLKETLAKWDGMGVHLVDTAYVLSHMIPTK